MMNPIAALRRLSRNVGTLTRQMDEVITLRRTLPGTGTVIDGADIAAAGAAPLVANGDGQGAQAEIKVAPVAEIPYPVVDLALVSNPVRLFMSSRDFTATDRFFESSPALERSLVSVRTLALVYALVRNLRPEHVLEIGTYRAGTSEAICRALHANGLGTLHTSDPHSPPVVTDILSRWPAELRRHVRYYALDSMAFFAHLAPPPGIRPSLVLIDGIHDHEHAWFDIACAARLLAPGGFIAIDNVAQAGPYLAARDFLATHPGWTECTLIDYRYDPGTPFDRQRCGIPGTQLMLLRAPPGPVIGERPVPFPEIVRIGRSVNGIEFVPAPEPGGVLRAQCIARGFSPTQKTVEQVGAATMAIGAEHGGKRLRLAVPVALDASAFEHVRVEIWLSWTGERPLTLLDVPSAY